MIENQYRVHLNYRKYRFTSNWDFYSIASTQQWREIFEKAYREGKSVEVWI